MNSKNLFLFLFAVCILPASAFAAPIEAQIVRLDRDNSVLILSPIEPQHSGREVKVTLKEVKEYWGVNSLADLENGRVILNIEDSSADVWTTQSLELMQPVVEGGQTTYARQVNVMQVPGKTYEVMIEHDMPHDASNPKYVNLGRRGTETLTVAAPGTTVVTQPLVQVAQAGTTTTTTTVRKES